MLTRTEAIVLKSRNYSEADLIVTYLTADRGIINAFAKSPRKTKSRFGSSLEPLTHARISLWGKEQTAMPRLTQSDIITSFYQLRENYTDFINLSKLLEILISLTPEHIPNRKLFSFLLNMLELIKSSVQESKDALYMIAQIRLLALIGYAPRLKGCAKCSTHSLDFYPSSGATLCIRCASVPGSGEKKFIRTNNKVIHFYTHTIEWPINITNRLKPDQATISELSTLLDRHLDYLLSKRLHSSTYLTSTAQ